MSSPRPGPFCILKGCRVQVRVKGEGPPEIKLSPSNARHRTRALWMAAAEEAVVLVHLSHIRVDDFHHEHGPHLENGAKPLFES